MHLKKNGHIDATRNKDELRRFCDQFCQFVVDSIQEGLLSRCPFFISLFSCFLFLVFFSVSLCCFCVTSLLGQYFACPFSVCMCTCVVSVSRPYWANICVLPLCMCTSVVSVSHPYWANKPLARPWKCSQFGGQNKIFLHENRSQLPEEKISFVFCPPDWLHSYDVQGVYICVFPFCVMYLCLALIVHCATVSVSVSALVP